MTMCGRSSILVLLLLCAFGSAAAQEQKTQPVKPVQETWREKAQKKILEKEMATACAKSTQAEGALNQCTCRPVCLRGGLVTLSGDEKDLFTACTDASLCTGVAPPLVYQPRKSILPDPFEIIVRPNEVWG